MAATVKVIAYAAAIAVPQHPTGRYTTDSVALLKQPYLAREVLTPDTSTAVSSSSSTAPTGTQFVEVQVQDGKTICYEVTPAGQTAVTATQSSPWLSGRALLHFGAGWTISVIEAT